MKRFLITLSVVSFTALVAITSCVKYEKENPVMKSNCEIINEFNDFNTDFFNERGVERILCLENPQGFYIDTRVSRGWKVLWADAKGAYAGWKFGSKFGAVFGPGSAIIGGTLGGVLAGSIASLAKYHSTESVTPLGKTCIALVDSGDIYDPEITYAAYLRIN